eukprot:13281140-Alexandrium_andersonii.AAC.1
MQVLASESCQSQGLKQLEHKSSSPQYSGHDLVGDTLRPDRDREATHLSSEYAFGLRLANA